MSDSSSLSSPPSTDDEKPVIKTLTIKKGKLAGAGPPRKKNAAPPLLSPKSSPEPTREPSPPHEYTLADNPDIAVIAMFRARFSEVFPKTVPNLGPQDIEIGVSDPEPSEQIEQLLCALLGLVLNRKKYVERGHHARALEEAVQSQKHQWPTPWQGENPLKGDRTFSTMDPKERITLLLTLVHWCLSSSEAVGALVKESYKGTRHEDDLNQPRSVQPWGSDGRKRRYWLIEGQNDTTFRLYRENPPKLVNRTWWSIAGTIDELKAIGQELRSDGSQAARRLADRIDQSIPRLEQSEDKRKRREYRQTRKAAFTRPEPGFSLYEGRTRGKRMRYTFSDDEDEGSDATSVRRSTRNGSTPAEFAETTVTASGRHVRSKYGRSYGDALDSRNGSVDPNGSEVSEHLRGGDARVTRSRETRQAARPNRRTRMDQYNSVDELDDEEDAASTGDQWSGDDNDPDGRFDDNGGGDDEDDDDSMTDDDLRDELDIDMPRSLVVRLRYSRNNTRQGDHPSNRHDEPIAAEVISNGQNASVAQSDHAAIDDIHSPSVDHNGETPGIGNHQSSDQARPQKLPSISQLLNPEPDMHKSNTIEALLNPSIQPLPSHQEITQLPASGLPLVKPDTFRYSQTAIPGIAKDISQEQPSAPPPTPAYTNSNGNVVARPQISGGATASGPV